MVKKTKLGKDRLDKYYYLAKEQGYRSRASFKLIQLNKKYDFLESAKVVVDLCAAPGGWLQVVKKYQPMTGVAVGVDLANIQKIPGCTTFVGDITTTKTLKRIKTEIHGQKSDVVIHDGAPNVGANWFKDAYSQSELVLYAGKIAANVLRAGGLFVTKVFRSQDYTALLWVFNQLFDKVEATKPSASRNTSAEIYLVCVGYKAPKEIDPKLFNPAFVFEQVESGTLKKLAPHELVKRKNRNREGYEDDAYVLFKKCPTSEFIDSNRPTNMLAEYNEFLFDDPISKKYFDHAETSKEVKILCSDLKVLGMSDFRLLLKWRQKMRDFKNSEEVKDNEMEAEEEEETNEASETKEEKLEKMTEDELSSELSEMREKALKFKRNLIKKAKIKETKRQPLPFDMTEDKSDIIDNLVDKELFTLSSVSDREMLKSEDTIKAQYDQMAKLAETQYKENQKKSEKDDVIRERVLLKDRDVDPDYDSDVEYDKALEEQFNHMYNEYLQQLPSKKKKLDYSHLQDAKKEKEDVNEAIKEEALQFIDSKNKLVVDMDQKVQPSIKTQQWFSQNIFNVLNEQDLLSAKQLKEKEQPGQTYEEEEDSDSSDDEENYNKLKDKVQKEKKKEKDTDEIEELPEEMHDEDTRATTLALAKKMLKKKERREFIDGAFHRYAFNDTDNLPDWYVTQERKFFTKELPVTKEEVEAEKQRLKELDARPMRKVLEAKFRKRRKMQKKVQQLKEKANVVADSKELTNIEKVKELQKIYKQAKVTGQRKKIYVVSSKHASKGKGGKKYVKGNLVSYVDQRLKKDKRANKHNSEKK